MSVPINMDEYQAYLAQDENELVENNVPQHIIERVIRFRALYTYWCRFSSKSVREMVEYDMAYFKVKDSQAYDDMHCIQILMGNLQETSKKFHRWRVNQMIEEDRKAAKRDGDHRAVASMQKNYILNNMTDKEDTPELSYDKIVPLAIEPTDDPTVIGIKKIPDLRGKIKKMLKKYNADIEYTEFQEVSESNANDTETVL